MKKYKIENGTLYITDNSKKEGFHNYMNLDLSFEFEKNLIKIYVPSGTVLKNTDIKLACGSIDLNSVLVESVKTSNGLGSTNIKLMNEAAEKAVQTCHGPGSFKAQLMDQVYQMSANALAAAFRGEEK